MISLRVAQRSLLLAIVAFVMGAAPVSAASLTEYPLETSLKSSCARSCGSTARLEIGNGDGEFTIPTASEKISWNGVRLELFTIRDSYLQALSGFVAPDAAQRFNGRLHSNSPEVVASNAVAVSKDENGQVIAYYLYQFIRGENGPNSDVALLTSAPLRYIERCGSN